MTSKRDPLNATDMQGFRVLPPHDRLTAMFNTAALDGRWLDTTPFGWHSLLLPVAKPA